MDYTYDDGGRAAAGYKGPTGDCVVRAVAIATQQPYQLVYDVLSEVCRNERRTKRNRRGMASAANGVRTTRVGFKRYMAQLGWVWVPTMGIGTGCQVHLVASELPAGRLVVAVSKHYTAVVDGVIHDTHDPSARPALMVPKPGGGWLVRKVERCVYGYWQKGGN